MSPPRLHITRRLRRALSLLLAVVIALSPVLSTAAQTHEAAHVAQGDSHFHADAHHDHVPVTGDDEMPDSDGVLHVLAHAAHACGHAVAIVGALCIAPSVDGADGCLPSLVSTPGDAPRGHPFRPPIAD
jgi:hypothetical protein